MNRAVLAVAATFMALLGVGANGGQPCDFDGTPPGVPLDFIRTNYRGAVLRLLCCGSAPESAAKPGSGFLIDADHGYVLTANHVVETSTGTDIWGYSVRRPGQAFRLKVVLPRDTTNDVTLLQLEPSDALSGVLPLDLALAVPAGGKDFTSISYPREDGVQNADVRTQGCEIKGRYNKTNLLVKRDSFVGDSGSPLIDGRGKAIAVAVDKNEAGTIYVPLARTANTIIPLLLMSQRMTKLDSLIRKHSISIDSLSEELVPTVTGLPNVDLLAWSRVAKDKLNEFSASRDLVECPILKAMEQRDLNDAILQLAEVGQSVVVGRASLALGERAISLADNPSAIPLLERAASLLETGSSADDIKKDPTVGGYIALDRARALLRLAEITKKDSYADNASELAGRVVLAANSQQQKGLALTMLGDALLNLNDPKTAAAAYARARTLGYGLTWVTTNWADAKERQTGKKPSNPDKLIMRAERIPDSRVLDIARFQ